MPEDRQVVFRRINGRIVPIRKKIGEARQRRMARSAQEKEKSTANKIKSAGFITGGFGVSILGGVLSGREFGKGVRGKRGAFKMGREGGLAGAVTGAHVFQKSRKKIVFGKKSAIATKLVGGAIIGRGLSKAASEAGFQESDTAHIVSGVAGEAAAFGVAAGFKKAASKKSFRGTFKSAAKIFARKKFKIPL